MNLINLKRVDNYEVQKWLENNIRDLTNEQIMWIHEDQIIRSAPFYFMKRRKKTNSVWLRLSIIFLLPTLLLLLIGLPFNYFITGNWGYNDGIMKWYSKWVSKCGF